MVLRWNNSKLNWKKHKIFFFANLGGEDPDVLRQSRLRSSALQQQHRGSQGHSLPRARQMVRRLSGQVLSEQDLRPVSGAPQVVDGGRGNKAAALRVS